MEHTIAGRVKYVEIARGDMMAKICLQCRYFYHGHGKKPSLCTNRHSEKFPDKLRQDGHTPVCRHFRPPKHHHVGLLAQYKNKLRFVESLRDDCAGEEVWVLATGPSLDYLPDNFLSDEKICIAVKEAGIAFPTCTYNMWPFRAKELKYYLSLGKIPKVSGRVPYEKFIFTILRSDCENWLGEQCTQPTYMRMVKGGTIEKLEEMCNHIINRNSSVYYGMGTISHLAIALAVMMGAARISLVGCDHGAIDGRGHATRRGLSGGYGWSRYTPSSYEQMHEGTNFLANFFKHHGHEIVRYHHGVGYREIANEGL